MRRLSSSFDAARTWRSRARHFGEEALDQIEPGAVLWGEHKGEASFRLRGHPGFGFLRDVRRVIVEDQPDGGVHRIGGIKLSEEGDELARTVSIFDTGMYATRQQVDPGSRLSVPWRLYSWSRANVACVPGCGGRSGAVLPMAWSPPQRSMCPPYRRRRARARRSPRSLDWRDVQWWHLCG